MWSNISFDESAVDELIKQAIKTGQEAGPLAFQMAKRLEYGLKLVKDRSGMMNFTINAGAVTDMERYVNGLVKKYYREDCGDYSRVLLGLLYYGDKKYEKAISELKKIKEKSIYSYSTGTIIEDIDKIKKGDKPSFSVASEDTYRIWEPYSDTGFKLAPSETRLTAAPTSALAFSVASLWSSVIQEQCSGILAISKR